MEKDICPNCHVNYCVTSICAECAHNLSHLGKFPANNSWLNWHKIPTQFIFDIFQSDDGNNNKLEYNRHSAVGEMVYSEYKYITKGGIPNIACRFRGLDSQHNNEPYDRIQFYIEDYD